MSPTMTDYGNSPQGFPRVSGDEPGHIVLPTGEVTFSPRERG